MPFESMNYMVEIGDWHGLNLCDDLHRGGLCIKSQNLEY